MSKKKRNPKLFEFVGYCKWAVVIAADTEAKAKAALKALDSDGNTWANVAEEIGFDAAADLELVDIRETTEEQRRDPELLAEAAHIVVKE